MTDTVSPIEAAQDAFRRQDWARARDRFDAARRAGLLDADGLFTLAEAAWWLGEMDESLAAFEQAYRQYLQAGRPLRAAMAAMFLGGRFSERGDLAVGSGWMSRMRRLLRDQPEGPEHGYTLYYEIFEAMAGGDLDGAIAHARRMQALGRRFDDPNLIGVGVLGEGRARLRQGQLEQWQAHLDELGIKHGGIAEDANGFGLSFRDPDNIALELWAPRS